MTERLFHEMSELFSKIRYLSEVLEKVKRGMIVEVNTVYSVSFFQRLLNEELSDETNAEIEFHKNSIKNLIENNLEKRLAKLKDDFEKL